MQASATPLKFKVGQIIDGWVIFDPFVAVDTEKMEAQAPVNQPKPAGADPQKIKKKINDNKVDGTPMVN